MNATEEQTQHLVRCYANVQEVIRFLDTKAAVVFTLAGVMLGVLSAKPSEWCDWAKIPLGGVVVFTIAAMFLALRTVWPSQGPKDAVHLTLLFPALQPRIFGRAREDVDIAQLVAAKLNNPWPADFVRNEYGAQLAYTHHILIRKISALRGAIWGITIAIGCLGICQFGKLDEKAMDPLKVDANSTIMDRAPKSNPPP